MFESVTSLQEEAWLRSFEGTDLKGSPYPVTACWELDGAVDESALSEALFALAMRHEGLRRSFPWLSDDPTRAWVDSDVVVPLQLRKGTADEEQTRAELLRALMTPFDARAAPLWRVVLVRCSEHRSYLGFAADHMICDGVSLSVFLKELTVAYGLALVGRPVDLGRPAAAYSDFAERQRGSFSGVWGEERRVFWTDYVRRRGKYPPDCGLAHPEDARGRGGGPVGGRLLTVGVDSQVMKAAEELARSWRVTRFALVTSTVLTAMARVLDDTRVGVSLDIHGRLLPGAGAAIGLFSHGVPLNVDLLADSDARERAQAVAVAMTEMLTYGVPLRCAAPKWGLDITRSHASTFVLFKFNAARWATDFRLGDLPARICKLRPPKEEREIKLPGLLDLELAEGSEGLTIEAHFDESVYPVRTVQEWLDRSVCELELLSAA
ncbi:condensation domain-containing protein [Streptomyces cyaneofuscatus]|uniref:condensation domain-containing protein n=1 Tax=Streptomyces cyaneofuscatus TaxID=66883 RepID=UPI0033B2DBD3